MKKVLVLIVGAYVLASARTVIAVPVVPNFTQGSMQSTTETTSTVSETINSIDYNTGYQYVITGTNIKADGVTLSAPSVTSGTNTIEGVTSTWRSIRSKSGPLTLFKYFCTTCIMISNISFIGYYRIKNFKTIWKIDFKRF